MKWISLLGLFVLANCQCNHQTDIGGGRWSYQDNPRNTTTQDFATLNNSDSWNRNRYLYIPNDAAGEVLFNTRWVNQSLAEKTAQTPYIRVEGYKYAMIEPYNAKVPCVSIEGAADFGVEIMVYAMDDVEICVRDTFQAGTLNAQTSQLFNDVCGQQRLRHCFIGPGNAPVQQVGDLAPAIPRPTNFNFEIYVRGSNPPDYGVAVFYRVRRSQYSYFTQGSQLSSGNTEMWCSMISGSVDTTWPEFVLPVPASGGVLPRTNSAPSRMSLMMSAIVAMVATALIVLG